jgi:hypothetical protein
MTKHLDSDDILKWAARVAVTIPTLGSAAISVYYFAKGNILGGIVYGGCAAYIGIQGSKDIKFFEAAD